MKRAFDILSFLVAPFSLANLARHRSHEGLSASAALLFLLGLVLAFSSLGWICFRLQTEYPRLTGATRRELIDESRMDLDIVTILSKNHAVRRQMSIRLLIVALVPVVVLAVVVSKLAGYLQLDALLTLF